ALAIVPAADLVTASAPRELVEIRIEREEHPDVAVAIHTQHQQVAVVPRLDLHLDPVAGSVVAAVQVNRDRALRIPRTRYGSSERGGKEEGIEGRHSSLRGYVLLKCRPVVFRNPCQT